MKGKVSTQMTQIERIDADQWMSVKDYAALKGISERAVRKNIASGKYQVKEVPHPSRADQVSYLVYHETAEPDCGTKCGTAELRNQTAEPDCGTKCGTAELRNQTAEPEAATCNLQPEAATCNRQPEATTYNLVEEVEEIPACAPQEAARCQEIPAYAGMTAGGDQRQDATATLEYVPYHKMDEARLYALLMETIDRRLHETESRTEEWQRITMEYNQGELLPELRKLKGVRSERGLRHWYQKWQGSSRDMFELVHKNTAQIRGRKVTYLEQRFLIAALLCGWEKPVMTAVRELKAQAAMGALESPSSVATLKRWCGDFAQDNPGVWCQGRRGDKAVKDTIIKSIDRDDSSIKPLQVFVVDGHTLSVFVKHPITGKPFRPTLIMVFDWGSRYPAGMSLALTEDSQHTLTAFRNAFLHAGVLPPWAYLDNGKAFRSKLFNAKWEEHDLEKEFAGIFPRLGIEAHFARPYNARAKVVERFFKTMQDQWEKRQQSYCGAGIHNKPAHMARNEKWMQEMYGAKAMEYNECMDSIYEWIRYEYGISVHQGIKAKPYEAFMNAERLPERQFDPTQLNILMLTAERKRLREEGITLNKNRYWAPELVDHVGKSLVIRYDYADLRSIFVYDEQSRYICQAELRESQSAWVHGEMYNPLSAQKLYAEDKEISNIHKRIRRDTQRLVKHSKQVVGQELEKIQGIIDKRAAQTRESNPAFRNPPMMPAPQKRWDIQEEVEKLERVAKGVETGDVGEGVQEIPAFPPQQPTSCLPGTPVAGMTAGGAGMTAGGAGMTAGSAGMTAEDQRQQAAATLMRQDAASTLQRQDAAATLKNPGKVINLEELLAEDEEEGAFTSFEEMQKIIGLKR